MSSNSLGELRLVDASSRGVSLSIDRPCWPLGRIPLTVFYLVDHLLIAALPVALRVCVFAHFVPCRGQGQTVGTWDLAMLHLLPAQGSAVEQLWLMHQFVAGHGVHALGGDLIVSELHIGVRVLVVNASESLVVSKHFLAIGFSCGDVFVVLTGELVLTWLQVAVWLVSKRKIRRES